MGRLPINHRRLYGYMCVLLLLQEFHVVIRADINQVYGNVKDLTEKFERQQTGLKARAINYLKGCSEHRVKDVEILGRSNSPQGVIMKLMYTIVFTLGNCVSTARKVLQEIIDVAGEDVLNEVVTMVADTTDEIEKKGKVENPSSSELQGAEKMTAEQDKAFLSGLLTENLLNIAEMWKLFDKIAKGDSFENETEVLHQTYEVGDFEQRIKDQHDNGWLPAPRVIGRLNSSYNTADKQFDIANQQGRTGQRLMREISVPYQTVSATDLFMIYNKESRKVLGVKQNNFYLSEYDATNLMQQLWVIVHGHVINVGSRLAIKVANVGNASSIITLGSAAKANAWRIYGQYIVSNFDSRCVLQLQSSPDTNSTIVFNVTLDCGINIVDAMASVVFYQHANTSESFYKNIEQPPVSYLKSQFARLIKSKFMVFIKLLKYIIAPSRNEHKDQYTFLEPQKQRLDSTFFIKNTAKPCKVLSGIDIDGTLEVTLEDFAEDAIEFQLWYWKDSQLINVGSRAPLEINTVLNNQNQITQGTTYFRLWTLNENTLLSNGSCQLIFHESTSSFALDCESRPHLSQWEFVTFDKPNFNNFAKLVCLFFIQSFLWPYELVTSFKNNTHLITSPLITENIFCQLWYRSNERLINAWTGEGISKDSDTNTLQSAKVTKTLTKWSVNTDTISLSGSSDFVLTLDTRKNGTITLDENKGRPYQYWKKVYFDINSPSINGSFACSDKISHTFTSYVIRNNEQEPCRLLTIVNDTSGSFSIQMRLFDAEYADHFKWFHYQGSLINVATCLAIQPDIRSSFGSKHILIPEKLNAFQQKQKWIIDSSQLLRWDLNPQCFMDYVENKLMMICDKNRSVAPKWNFTPLPLEEKELLITWSTLMCFYFLKSANEPCQYITADPEHGSVHLRPMTEGLLGNQLWYWNERTLAVATTGQLMGIFDLNLTSPWVQLVNPEEKIAFTSWQFMNGKLTFSPTGSNLAIDVSNNGKLFLSKGRTDKSIPVSFVEYNSFKIDKTDKTCSITVDERLEVFFIRSYLYDCLVLTGSKIGEPPIFEYFDQDDIESQLWFIVDNHIINFKSHLVLQADAATLKSGSHVIMQNYYKYANNQKWTLSGEMIFYYHSEECVQDVDKKDSALLVWCHSHGGHNQRWETILFDDDSDYLQTVTCLFFLRHELVPCDMLTHTNNANVLLRPVTAELFANQLWYWSKKSLINAKSGLALDVLDTGSVSLSKKDKSQLSQQWIKRKTHIVSAKDNVSILGLDKNNGILKLLDPNYSHNTGVSEWNFVGIEDGTNDPSLLQCEQINNQTMYIIRSDKDPCHILSEKEGGQITLLKAGSDSSKQVWINVRRHIVNALSGKALSVNKLKNLEPVRAVHRYEHELKQQWRKVNSSILIGQTGNSKALDAYGDVTVNKQDGTDGQKWTWLNLKDVEYDEKLLRCSFCYNKGEENANEVMSYFPILGWVYSLTRAAVYAGKGCDEVALGSLEDFGIGAAMDIGIGLVTVATMGTGSAAALGVKTAIQSGVKAGLKISVKAASSSIQLAVRQALNTGKVVLKQGIKKSMIQFSKQKISNIKFTLKSEMMKIKQLPIKTKILLVKTGKSVKKLPSKVYNSVRSTSYGTLKATLSERIKRLPTKLKKKLNKIGNELAERAESKINQLDDIKKSKPSTNVRCKRSPDLNCITSKKTGSKPRKKTTIEESAFIPNPNANVQESFKRLLDVAKRNADVKGLQNAHFGLATRKLHSGIEYKLDKNTVRSKVLRDVDEYPYDKNFNKIEKTQKGDRKPQSHTEQALLDDIDKSIKTNCAGKNCELYMWTKNSPCMINTYTFREQNRENIIPAKSCFSMLLELCHKHVKFTPGFTRCNIGFSDFYFSADRINPEKRFMAELQGLTETTKNLASKHNRYPTLTQESLENIGKFIRFYRIPV